MNVTLSGGTTQQRQWATEAFDVCNYPFDALGADVTITWAPTTPCGADHPYMCTRQHSPTSYVITIVSDADVVTGGETSGLPNPAGDIKEFYMQSLIHEIGHVAQYVFLDSDLLKTQAAALFWRSDPSSGTSRRWGTLADYAATAWADRIGEAIAECVKCGWYTGRLIYMNRTAWNIDEVQWCALCGMVD